MNTIVFSFVRTSSWGRPFTAEPCSGFHVYGH